jgi:hypothetical protein
VVAPLFALVRFRAALFENLAVSSAVDLESLLVLWRLFAKSLATAATQCAEAAPLSDTLAAAVDRASAALGVRSVCLFLPTSSDTMQAVMASSPLLWKHGGHPLPYRDAVVADLASGLDELATELHASTGASRRSDLATLLMIVFLD